MKLKTLAADATAAPKDEYENVEHNVGGEFGDDGASAWCETCGWGGPWRSTGSFDTDQAAVTADGWAHYNEMEAQRAAK